MLKWTDRDMVGMVRTLLAEEKRTGVGLRDKRWDPILIPDPPDSVAAETGAESEFDRIWARRMRGEK